MSKLFELCVYISEAQPRLFSCHRRRKVEAIDYRTPLSFHHHSRKRSNLLASRGKKNLNRIKKNYYCCIVLTEIASETPSS